MREPNVIDCRDARAFVLAVCADPDGDHQARWRGLSASDCAQVIELASLSRTEPLLAAALSGTSHPGEHHAAVHATLAKAAQDYAMQSLSMASGMRRTIEIVQDAGSDPIALKGLGLAYKHYPEPHLRPLRDLDLLFEPELATKAHAALLADPDFDRLEATETYGIERSHQLPEIVHGPTGLVIDVHHRINASGWRGEKALLAAIREASDAIDILDQNVRVPSPAANALHLVVHATIHHLFSNGPLVLADLHYLSGALGGGWPELEAMADDIALGRALDLMVALCRSEGASWPDRVGARAARVGPRNLDAAKNAMFDDPTARQRMAMMRRLGENASGKTGWTAALSRLFSPDDYHLAELSGRAHDHPLRWLAYPSWVWGKGTRYLSSATDSATRDEAARRGDLSDWLKGGAHGE